MAPKTRPVEERFWEKVRRAGPDECWEWTAQRCGYGYGHFGVWFRGRQKTWKAHRLAWVLTNGGSVPPGMYVLHHCDNPPCVNPAHLFLGTIQRNSDDMVAKGRSLRHSRNPNFKIPDALAAVAVSAYRAGHGSQEEVARKFGISQPQLSRLARGVRTGS